MMISVRMGVTRTSTPGVAVLGQGALQELVQLRVEDAVGHELALLGDLRLARHVRSEPLLLSVHAGGALLTV